MTRPSPPCPWLTLPRSKPADVSARVPVEESRAQGPRATLARGTRSSCPHVSCARLALVEGQISPDISGGTGKQDFRETPVLMSEPSRQTAYLTVTASKEHP
jgi:hypothetical protein